MFFKDLGGLITEIFKVLNIHMSNVSRTTHFSSARHTSRPGGGCKWNFFYLGGLELSFGGVGGSSCHLGGLGLFLLFGGVQPPRGGDR